MAFTYFHVNFHLVLIESFKYGINTGLRHWRTALIGYVFQLLLVFTVGMQIYQVFEASIGNSLGINELMDGFDDTVVSDFIQVHGASLSPLLGQLRYLFLVYLVFSVFINAGLLFAVSEEKPGWVSFWEGGKKYFLHFFVLALIFLLLVVIWSAFTLVPFLAYMQPSIEDFSSEKVTVYLLFVVLFVWLLGLIYLFNASVAARLRIMEADKSIWDSFIAGIGFAFRRFFSLAGLFLLFFFLQIVFIVIYWVAEDGSGMISPLLVFVFFIVQQIMVFFRWMFRLAMYGGIKKFAAANG